MRAQLGWGGEVVVGDIFVLNQNNKHDNYLY